MNIKAYAYDLNGEDKIVINRMMNFLGKVGQIIDLKSFPIESDENTILLLFGPRALQLGKDSPALQKIIFPAASKLIGNENREFRLRAKALLEELKKFLDSAPADTDTGSQPSSQVVTIHEGLLPERLTSKSVEELERQQREKGTTIWKCTRRDGKRITVTTEPSIDPKADLNVTFAELYALLGLMEVFQVKEISLVPSDLPARSNQTSNLDQPKDH